MRLLEIEPGHYIVPDLVTEVRVVYKGEFDFCAEIVMAVGPPAYTRIRPPPGDCVVEKNGVGHVVSQVPAVDVVKEAGRRYARGLATLISDHQTGERFEVVHP